MSIEHWKRYRSAKTASSSDLSFGTDRLSNSTYYMFAKTYWTELTDFIAKIMKHVHINYYILILISNWYFLLNDNNNDTLVQLVDTHTSLVEVTMGSRPTAHWCDARCCNAKANTRRLERFYRTSETSAARVAWRMQSRYLRKMHQKR